jgi:hypothetical protein
VEAFVQSQMQALALLRVYSYQEFDCSFDKPKSFKCAVNKGCGSSAGTVTLFMFVAV